MYELSRDREWMSDAISMIESDLRKHFTIQEIASEIGTNPFSLKHAFKRKFKMGPYEYLLEARLKKASELLVQTDYPIKMICKQVGYKSPSSFIVVFKKRHGLTPLAWRNKERQKHT